MKALIDGDILIYRVGYTTQNEDWGIAQYRINEMIDNILEATKADAYDIYLSDATENNFRRHIYPLYKANRHQPKPKHYEALKYYLVSEEGAYITPEQEADDILGIMQDKVKGDTVICTIDKDLLQVPGNHYNFVNNLSAVVDQLSGANHFYRQLLVGDVADNVRGVHGIGRVKSGKILAECETEDEMFEQVYETYLMWLKDDSLAEHMMLMNGRLLRIRQQPEEIWNFPSNYQKLQPKTEDLYSFLQTKLEEIIRSSEPTSQE